MYAALDEVDISKAKEEQLKKIIKENREIEEDINTLRTIGEQHLNTVDSAESLNDNAGHEATLGHILGQAFSPNLVTGDATSRLHCPHKDLTDLTRQMLAQLNRQHSERQNADSQQAMYLDLKVEGGESITLVFGDAERRARWEDAFAEAKQKLGKKRTLILSARMIL